MDKKKMNIADVMLDGCKFLGSFYTNFIYGKFFKRIQSLSNLPKKCPLLAVSRLPSLPTPVEIPLIPLPLQKKRYEIRNYSVIPDEFPLGSPALQYQMSLTFYWSNRTVARVSNDGAVVYKERK